jgi:hypothetical protein
MNERSLAMNEREVIFCNPRIVIQRSAVGILGCTKIRLTFTFPAFDLVLSVVFSALC